MLKDTTVLITGASAGIGRATVLAMARAGAHVLAAGRRAHALDTLARECVALGAPIETLAGDITNHEFVDQLVARAGAIDILVNNAGVLTYAPILETAPEDCEAMFRVNVLATLRLTQGVARHMVARAKGHIIMVTSTGAREVMKFGGVYCATKHALSALTRSLRIELQAHGIHVSEVAPGMVRTDIRDGSRHPEVLAAMAARTTVPLPPESVADAIVHVASSPGAIGCIDYLELRPNGVATH